MGRRGAAARKEGGGGGAGSRDRRERPTRSASGSASGGGYYAQRLTPAGGMVGTSGFPARDRYQSWAKEGSKDGQASCLRFRRCPGSDEHLGDAGNIGVS